MYRTVIRHTTAAALSTGLAAVVVLVASFLALPSLSYPALVVVGAVASVIGASMADIEGDIYLSIWTLWVLALLFDPTPALAYGLLIGIVVGLLAIPVVLKLGNTIGSLTN